MGGPEFRDQPVAVSCGPVENIGLSVEVCSWPSTVPVSMLTSVLTASLNRKRIKKKAAKKARMAGFYVEGVRLQELTSHIPAYECKSNAAAKAALVAV